MTALSSSVIEPLVWFVGGFLGGCLATYLILSKLAQNSTLEHHVTTTRPATATPKRRFTLLHAIGVLVLVLTIASAVQSWLTQQANNRLTACLVTYANAIADAIEVRSKASAEAQQAQDEMWRTLLQLTPGPESQAKARKVFQDYLDKRAQVAKAQQTNPYPPPPREVCPDSAS